MSEAIKAFQTLDNNTIILLIIRKVIFHMVAVPFFGFLRLDLSPSGYENRCFLVTLSSLIVRRPNLEVATKRLLHQQVKIPG